MNFKGFQKVSSDGKCTTLKHDHGHELKIAHSALSQKMRAELERLPSKEPQEFAEGGEAEEQDAPETDQPKQAPVVVNVNSGPPGQQGAQAAPQEPAPQEPMRAPASAPPSPANNDYSNAPMAGQPQQDQTSGLAPAQNSEAAAPSEPQESSIEPDAPVTPGQAPEQPQAPQEPAKPTYQQSYDDYKQAHQQQFAQEDAAFAQDLNSGHITPETYHDLFAKKDTLGKVGTIFGLMMSGAGSGLSHQPNALLSAMNQEINNDLQAQMTSKTNAQNFIKINQAQQLQNASIENMKKTGNLTDAQAKSFQVEAQTKAYALAQQQALRTALHNQTLMVTKLPEGPQKEQAKAALAMMATAVSAENANIGDVAASRLAMMNTIGSNGQDGGINTTGMKMIPGMEKLGSDIEQKTVPGFPGRAQIPVPQETRDRLSAQKQYDEKAQEYVDFAKKNSQNWSNMDLKQRQQIQNEGGAMAANLQSLYRNKIKGGVYKKGEQEFIQQIIPDQPAKWSASFNAIPKVEQTIRDNQNDLKNTAGSVGIKYAPKAPSTAAGGGNQNSQAIAWAKANPSDPRAGKILKLNGMQ